MRRDASQLRRREKGPAQMKKGKGASPDDSLDDNPDDCPTTYSLFSQRLVHDPRQPCRRSQQPSFRCSPSVLCAPQDTELPQERQAKLGPKRLQAAEEEDESMSQLDKNCWSLNPGGDVSAH